MDTKLKNSRNKRIAIIIAGILLAVIVNLCLFPWVKENAEERAEEVHASGENINNDYIDTLYEGSSVLYAEMNPQQAENQSSYFLSDESGAYEDYDYISEWAEEFEAVRSETDYYATDGTKEEINTNKDLKKVLEKDFDADSTRDDWNDYECLIELSYDENGNLTVEVKKTQTIAADLLIKEFLHADRYNALKQAAQESSYTYTPIKNFQVVYGISSENDNLIVEDHYTNNYYLTASYANPVYFFTMLAIAIFMCIMCSRKVWKKENLPDYLPKWRYMEIGIVGLIMSFAMCGLYIDTICEFPYRSRMGFADVRVWDVLKAGGILYVIFAVAFLSMLTIYPVFQIGIKEYIRQYSFIYQIFPWIWKKWNQFTDEVNHIDFSDKTTKTILKIVVINFLVLAVLMCMWMFGIVGLVIYSLVLFYLLKKYYDRIKKDYDVLMKGVQRIAEGDLDTVITEDIGVFEPFKEQLTQIRTGFKKAVEDEVKSQRMKTELITNVSHDLKTPLTAITTYVELLKKEDITEEERKSYIETLEKKSLRLKVLIEDLFEVSKASTNNITLNLMDVDVVNLMKQVSVEHTDKFEQLGLKLRWNVPDEKIILKLDNQKTYRIFENLFVNIQKYAMPDSRVYIDVERIKNQVVITMRNMSAVELHVKGEELTERFVRGDASRNTEGSGLGLAIAKSFTEAQKGNLNISVDGDLFKVVIVWK